MKPSDRSVGETTSPPTAGQLLHILVVDDDTNVREVMVRSLQFEGLRASAAESGEAAIELVRRQTFDCVVLDLTMPMLSGSETFAALRQIQASIPVVLASGRRDENIDQLLLVHARVRFLAKPFTPSQLRATVLDICCH